MSETVCLLELNLPNFVLIHTSSSDMPQIYMYVLAIAVCTFKKVLSIILYRFGHLNIVKYLVEDQQCDVNVITDWGSTLLHFSCE